MDTMTKPSLPSVMKARLPKVEVEMMNCSVASDTPGLTHEDSQGRPYQVGDASQFHVKHIAPDHRINNYTVKSGSVGSPGPPGTERKESDIMLVVLEEFVKRARRTGESDDEVRRKVLLLPPCVIMFLFFFVFLIYECISHEVSGPIRIGLSSIACLTLFAVCFSAFRYRIMSMRLVERSVVVLLLCALVSDLVNVGLYEQWFIAILLMNALLLTDPEPRLSWTLFGLTMIWIIVRSVEDASRFGLYARIPYNDVKLPRPEEGWRWGVSVIVLRVGVFSLDHALTRRFFHGMKTEREALKKSVVMAEKIAEALVKFDLETAEELVTNNRNVAMRESFEKLLANLRLYRPYLPATLFHGDEAEDAFNPNRSQQHIQQEELPGLVISVEGTNQDNEASRARDEETLRQRLEVGMRMRRGTLVMCMFEAFTVSLQECFNLAAPFAEVVLTEVAKWGGIVVDLKGPTVYCSWNTHLPCPRHAYHASRCCLALSCGLQSGKVSYPFTSFSAASGNLAIGSTGLDWQRAPFVYGSPLCQVDALSMLSRAINCRILITEAVFEAVRTQVPARLIDVIPEMPLSTKAPAAMFFNQANASSREASVMFSEDRIGVYELLEKAPTHLSLYSDAFIALRGNKGEFAVSLFMQFVTRNPEDPQGGRLLKLAAAARESACFLPQPYVRELVGWSNFEDAAEGLVPDEIGHFLRSHLDQRIAQLSNTVSKASPHAGGPAKGEDLFDQLRKVSHRKDPKKTPRDRRSMSVVTLETSCGSEVTPLDQSLRLTQAESHEGTSASSCMDQAILDVEGSKWYKSDKMLGNGSYGEVWLGMGEDGALVAMKWLRAVIPMDHTTEKSSAIKTDPCGIDSSDDSDLIPTTDLLTSPPASERSNMHNPDPVRPVGLGVGDTTVSASVDTFKSEAWEPSSQQLNIDAVEAEGVLDAIKKEVELLSRLQHENIVSYLSLAVTDGCVVINMEYVPGGSLQNLLEQFGKLPMSSIRRYVKDIVKGLRYLHKMDVAHRDFKPANVLVQIDGQCKLSDFGASAIMGDVVGKKIVGTLIYMAPEACRGEAGMESDIWSVGITTCQMITSALPFPPKLLTEPHAFLYQLAMAKEAALPVVPATVRPDAMLFIKECLIVNHKNRPSAEKLLLSTFLSS